MGNTRARARSPRRIHGMSGWVIREARSGDEADLAKLMATLWTEGNAEEHRCEAEMLIRTRKCGTQPGTVFVAEENEQLIGFIQAGLRSHADGCDPAQPVGFIEGWFVREDSRERGIGRSLMQAAVDWSRGMGCKEMASDAVLDNPGSHSAHTALGFDIVDRCVHFRKRI